ncbi:Rne/Rng family ribonuclease [Pseudoprimorskyibacter insulae]|uniref:Ribonuclease E n=1 Tax=Pseudoprimorskyibacter insulae TaxID=1695997 RepID=A0A2R8AVU0_9RHOB|nr:ribonuclease E/G [Pseudoprimorskyibacter insulae]SPF80151.1 Ribonuclease E [Pseudoprimorskyibacter insulae]
MAKKMLIDATHAEETRVVVVDGNKVEEFDFESENKRQLAGNIYLAKVTRVEPSLQAAFVDYGGNRHGFLAFSEIHPDYYQIPVADREALMEEERVYAESIRESEDGDSKEGKEKDKEEGGPRRRRRRSSNKAEKSAPKDVTASKDVSDTISGMETIDLDTDSDDEEGLSPMETVAETPVEEPQDTPADGDAVAEGAAEAPVEAEAETAVEAAPEAEAETAEAPAEVEVESEEAEEADAEAEEDEDDTKADAAAKDESIESVADDDDHEDIRPPRKPRARRYKIQEVIKVRQILLVQVVKEERGNKGAALTTYLSLAGRYCVLMPNTARGGGISRKITQAADRKKLKEIATSIDVPQGAGLIIRTAGAKRTKTEIKRDYEYLQRLWEQIRELTLKSVAPAKIYEEGDLIKRSIRDLYNREIDEVLVEGERGYRIAKDFMKMIMPSHARNVKHYNEQMPLFARYQVESYLGGMFNPVVQLKSGGYIVIGVTEALVAIDVNSGRATKEGSIEETALKTNLEAAEEVARQLRLRDLAGLIVIDFIDMDERKNNASVEKRIKDKLKTDRARIQVGRISGFGLMEMSRQRLRPGMIEATTQPCPSCHGTGLIRSDDNMALSILRQIEEEGVRNRSREVLVRCPVGIANYLMNQKREHVAMIEGRYGLSVRIEGDPHLVSPDFTLEKFKTATRNVTPVETPVVSVDTSIMDEIDEEVEAEDLEVEADTEADRDEADDDQKPKKRRRRRRRRKGGNGDGTSSEDGSDNDSDADDNGSEDEGDDQAAASEDGEEEAKPKKRRRSRRRRKDKPTEEGAGNDGAEGEGEEAASEVTASEETPVETAAAEGDASAEAVTEAEAPVAVEAATEAEVTEAAEAPADAAPEESAEVVEVQSEAETTTEEPAAEAEPAPEAAAEPVEAAAEPAEVAEPVEAEAVEAEAVEAQAEEPVAEAPAEVAEVAEEPAAEADVAEAPAEEPVLETAAAEPAPVEETAEEEDPNKPKRRGWWSR